MGERKFPKLKIEFSHSLERDGVIIQFKEFFVRLSRWTELVEVLTKPDIIKKFSMFLSPFVKLRVTETGFSHNLLHGNEIDCCHSCGSRNTESKIEIVPRLFGNDNYVYHYFTNDLSFRNLQQIYLSK